MLPHAGGNDLFVLYIFKCVSQDNLNVNAFRVKREEQINQLKDELKHIGSNILQ